VTYSCCDLVMTPWSLVGVP